jgi:cyclase
MLRRRIIPKILVRTLGKHQVAAISKSFETFFNVGNPLSQLKIMDSNKADEIAITYLNPKGSSADRDFLKTLSTFVSNSTTPLSAGGGIKTKDDIKRFMDTGIEKITIPITEDRSNLELVQFTAQNYGKQAIQVCLDYKATQNSYFIHGFNTGRSLTGIGNLIHEYETIGAGEIVITNIDRDGSKIGLDLEFFAAVAPLASTPLVISGGAGSAENFVDAFNAGADAVMCGTYFAKMDHNLLQLRSKISVGGINVRSII